MTDIPRYPFWLEKMMRRHISAEECRKHKMKSNENGNRKMTHQMICLNSKAEGVYLN